MNVSFDRKTALMLLRHVGRRPAPGAKTDPDVQAIATCGRFYLKNSHTTAACHALVLEAGSFVIQRARFEQLLRSFDREIIILEADQDRLKIGRFSCTVGSWQPRPEPPEGEVEVFQGNLRLPGENLRAN